MSLNISGALAGGLGGFLKGGIPGIAGGVIGGLFGGNGGPNIARSLSKRVGCTIAQSNADQARALMAKGIDPCTGQSTGANIVAGSQPYQPTGYTPTDYRMPAPVRQVLSTPAAPALPGPGGSTVSTTYIDGALEYTSTGLIKNVIVNGRRISRKTAAAMIRKHGIDVGAQGLGLTVQEAAQVVLHQASRPRRRRGLSYAQISNARRVMRTLDSMKKTLGCTTRRAPARRKPQCR